MSDPNLDKLIDAARRQAASAQTDIPTRPAAPAAPAASPSPGHGAATGASHPARVGPYRISHELGRGGMGRVLLGVRDDDQFKKQVAIKLLQRSMVDDEVVQRFELERQILSALNHPNIARLLDGGATEDDLPYLVMEYVAGQPITEYCDVQRLNLTERLRLFQKVCGAVHYAHANLIVHRDLKPSNILVGPDGEPKLLDFGIAKLLNPNLGGVVVVTRPILRLLTPEYASPEQVRGLPITTGSDVYALGVLLYELICGTRPYSFKEAVEHEIVRVVCEVEPKPPSTRFDHHAPPVQGPGRTKTLTTAEIARLREASPQRLRRDVRGDLDSIVLKALEKVPRHRYGSAEQFGEDLQRYLDGLPIIARRPSWAYRAAKALRRNRLAFGAAAAVVASLAIGFGVALWQWRVAHENELAATANAERARNSELAASASARLAQERGQGLLTVLSDLAQQMDEDMQALRGSTTARRRVLETAERIIDVMAPAGALDRQLQFTRGRVYLGLGKLRGALSGGGDDDGRAAHKPLTAAVEILRALAAGAPKDLGIWRHLSEAQRRAADNCVALGDAEAAEALATGAQETIDHLRTIATDERIANREQMRLLSVQGDIAKDAKKLGAARDFYERSLKIRAAALGAAPDDLEVQREMAVGHSKLAGLLVEAARSESAAAQDRTAAIEDARAHYKTALELRRRILGASVTNDASVDDDTARRDVAVSAEAYANVLRDDPSWRDEATALLRDAREKFRWLWRADPLDARGFRDYLRASSSLASILVEAAPLRATGAANNPAAEAISIFEEAADAGRRELERQPGAERTRWALASCLVKFAKSAAAPQIDDLERARALAREARPLLEETLKSPKARAQAEALLADVEALLKSDAGD